MLVPWEIHRLDKFDPAIRVPDQIVYGEKYWFFKYSSNDFMVDVIGVNKKWILSPLEERSRIYFQTLKYFGRIKDYNLVLTHDSQSAFFLAFLRSKLGFCRGIPHIMIDVGLPGAPERLFRKVPLSLKYYSLRQIFNKASVSHIIFHSLCQRPFYQEALNFEKDSLTYVPFGIETDYFKPESTVNEGYIYAAGEFRDFRSLLKVYERWHDILPELRIRSGLPPPTVLPPKVRWLPRASIAVFKNETLRAKFMIMPLQYTFRSAGVMTLLQSMALGKAVLVSQVPPIQDYVVDGKTALYYKPYDSDDLLKKILLLLNQPFLVNAMSKEARNVVERNFNLETMGKNLSRCISKALKD